jgi:hypothetical protein
MKFTFDVEIPAGDIERLRLHLTRELQKESPERFTPIATNTDIEKFLAIHVSASIEHFLKEHIPHAGKKKQTRHKEN